MVVRVGPVRACIFLSLFLLLLFFLSLFLKSVIGHHMRFRRRSNVRTLIESILGPRNAFDFCCWAFGLGFEDKRSIDLWRCWNQTHGDKKMLKVDGIISVDIHAMIDLWYKEKGN